MHNFKYKNLQYKHLLMTWLLIFNFFRNFVNMENIRRRYDPTVNLSKFTSNKKILSKVVV